MHEELNVLKWNKELSAIFWPMIEDDFQRVNVIISDLIEVTALIV